MMWNCTLYLSLACALVTVTSTTVYGEKDFYDSEYTIQAPQGADLSKPVKTPFFDQNPDSLVPLSLIPQSYFVRPKSGHGEDGVRAPMELNSCNSNLGCRPIDANVKIYDCRSAQGKCVTGRDFEDNKLGFTKVKVMIENQAQVGWIQSSQLKPVHAKLVREMEGLRISAPPPPPPQPLVDCCLKPEPVKKVAADKTKMVQAAASEMYFNGDCKKDRYATESATTVIAISQVPSFDGAEYSEVSSDRGESAKPISKTVKLKLDGKKKPILPLKPSELCKVEVKSCGSNGTSDFSTQLDLARLVLTRRDWWPPTPQKMRHQVCNMGLEQLYNTCDVWNGKTLNEKKELAAEESTYALENWKPVAVPRSSTSAVPPTTKSDELNDKSIMPCLMAKENQDFQPMRVNYTACQSGDPKSSAVGLTQLTQHLIETLVDGNFLDNYCEDFKKYFSKYNEKCVPGESAKEIFKKLSTDPVLQIAIGIVALNYKIQVSKEKTLDSGLRAWYGSRSSGDNSRFSGLVNRCMKCQADGGDKNKCLDTAVER
jgi:hypothetical protein